LLIDKDDRDADAAQEELENEKDGDEEDNPNPLYAGPRNHFYRMEMPAHQKSVKGKSVTKHNITGLNIHCICATPYNPTENDSVQRYCLDCQKWFHERCLESWTEPIPALDTPGGEPPAALGELAKLPIARGDWWGELIMLRTCLLKGRLNYLCYRYRRQLCYYQFGTLYHCCWKLRQLGGQPQLGWLGRMERSSSL